MKDKEIGKKIKELRLANKMTQAQLAEKLFVTDGVISKWENGKSLPDYNMLKQISKIFGVKTSEIIGEATERKFKDRLLFVIRFIKAHFLRIVFDIVFVLLLFFFLNNYNATSIYGIQEDSDFFDIEVGYFIVAKSRVVFTLNNIELDLDLSGYDEIDYKLYTYVNNEKIYFYEFAESDSIFFDYLKGEVFTEKVIAGIKHNLYFEVEATSEEATLVKSVKLSLDDLTDSDELFGKDKVSTYDSLVDNLKNIEVDGYMLLNKGFKKVGDTHTYEKTIEGDLISFNLDTNSMLVLISSKDVSNNYLYNYSQDRLDFKRISNRNNQIIVKYAYDKIEEKLNCVTGDCKNYLKDYDYVKEIFSDIVG